MVLDTIQQWFAEKFLNPLCSYYTPEATIVYGIVLALAVFGAFKIVKKLNVKIDRQFFYALLPFIIYGGWTRALRDHNLYQGKLFCSPPIYAVIFVIVIVSLILSILIGRKLKIDYWKLMLIPGISLLIYNATLTSVTNPNSVLMVAGLMVFWTLSLFAVHKFKPKLFSFQNAGITLSHMLDASSSFVAIQFFGFCEQHILNGVLMGSYCAADTLPSYLILPKMNWMIFIPKLILIPLVLYLIDKHSEDKEFANLMKIIILILGLALGIRDFLTAALI